MNESSGSVVEGMFQSILDLAIRPVVLGLSGEAAQSIELKASVLPYDFVAQRIEFFRAPNCSQGALAYGEARVLLKDSTYPCAFMIEAIFNGVSPGTGFSGFSIRGKLRLEGENPSVKITARTNRYNVWEWSRDFRKIQ